MYLDRSYRPRRRRHTGILGRFWLFFVLVILAIVLYEQQPAWLVPKTPTPTPIATRAAIAFIADAQNALKLGNYDVALAAFQQVNRIEPNNTEALIAQAEIYLIFQEPSKAYEFARRAHEATPENVLALAIQARSLNWQDRNEEALNAALDALELSPDNATVLAVLGEIYTDEGNWAVAEDYLGKALARDPNNLLALRNRSYLLERRGKYEESVAALQAAIAVAPRRFDLYMELGRQYRVGLADYAKANEAYTKAVSVYEAPVTLDAQGEGLYNSGDHLQAVRVLRKAVKIDPNYGPAHVHLGMALYARRNYEDAAVELEQGLTLIGDKARIEQLYTAGLAFINKEPSDCEKAIFWLYKALAIDKEAAPALQGLKACGQGEPVKSGS